MAKVYFKRRTTKEIEKLPVEDGSLIYNTDNGKTYMDFVGDRIQTGGNADTMIAIGGENPPEDTDIKMWFPDDVINTKASEVVNSMESNETDMAPSVHSVKKYIDNKNVYSTDEVEIGTWINGEKIYRKVIEATCPSTLSSWETITSGLGAKEIISHTGYVEFSTTEHKLLPSGINQTAYFQLNKDTHELQVATIDSCYYNKPMIIILYYFKEVSE